MIDAAERAWIHERATILEQIPSYVEAVTGLEPVLFEEHLLFRAARHVVIVGFPLEEDYDEGRLDQVVRRAVQTFDAESLSLLAPTAPPCLVDAAREPPDRYFRLDLAGLEIPQKVRHMLHRASQELEVRRGERFGRDHKKLVRGFRRTHSLDDGSDLIFERLPDYAVGETVRIYEARDAKGRLVAFDLAELAARDKAFYAFNFRSTKHEVPGASDLLLHAMIADATEEGRRWIGLGLGISEGVTFFKTKWGGSPYLDHVGCHLADASSLTRGGA